MAAVTSVGMAIWAASFVVFLVGCMFYRDISVEKIYTWGIGCIMVGLVGCVIAVIGAG